jgi:peptidyl-prolyl cis-trans isomerase C
MTLRLRPVTTRKRRSHWEQEERQQFWVTLGFIGLIVLSLLILGGAVAAGYYNDHLKPIAKVGDAAINSDMWRDRVNVELFRLETAERRVREAVASGEINQSFADQQLQQIAQQREDAPNNGIEALIDQRFQERLAGPLGVTVSDQDVDGLLGRESTTPEQRDVQAIFVKPEITTGAEEPTDAQKRAAKAKADEALAKLNEGVVSFADVARGWSTDGSRERGGEYGRLTEQNTTDDPWIKALFELPLNGTTPVIEGEDGTYRIGRVTNIIPEVKDEGYVRRIEDRMPLSAYRDALKGRLLAEKLEEKIVADATTGDVEQVKVQEIFIRAGDVTQDPTAALGEVKASHILYSPKDDTEGAAEIPQTDPSWAAAQTEADAAAGRLRAVANADDRSKQFAELARTASDDKSSGAQGGDLGYFTKQRMVAEFANAVFEGEHTAGEIIGPVKSQFGYHVILFVDRKGPPESRVREVLDALKQPNADFAKLARERSDDENVDEDAGDLGWIARAQVEKKQEDAIFALQPGQTTPEAIRLTDGFHIYKVTERATRPVDEEQRTEIEANAFENWYQPQKDAAEADGTIYRDPATFSPTVPTQ